MFKLKMFLRSLLGEGVWTVVQRFSMARRHRLIRLCQRETRGIVRSGPFAGTIYAHDSISGGYVANVLGIYERELHGTVARLAQLGIRQVLNIGAGDGYYAVGLARMFPDLRVIAFEMEPRGREFVREMAERNGVLSQIEIRGQCGVAELRDALIAPRETLVWCDVEGYEDVLMDPGEAAALRDAWVLVELHDGKNPGVSDRVRNRFNATHSIETIWQQARTASDFPFSTSYTRSLTPEQLAAAVDECRPVLPGVTPMSWFWMTPNAR